MKKITPRVNDQVLVFQYISGVIPQYPSIINDWKEQKSRKQQNCPNGEMVFN
jgi:hypothetical protein